MRRSITRDTRSGRCLGGRPWLVLGAAMVAAMVAATPAPTDAVDFVRGDVNNDGVLTISDAHLVSAYLFMGAPIEAIGCQDAGDVNDDGGINMADVVRILCYTSGIGCPEPPSPFPDVGPDPGGDDDEVPCGAYGGGAPLEDPGARLSILDASAPGGTTRLATVTLAVSSTARIAGYGGRIVDASGAIESFGVRIGNGVNDLTGLTAAGESLHFPDVVRRLDDRLRVVFFPIAFACPEGAFLDCRWIPAGERTPVLEITVCLAAGLPAGEYPLTLESGELIDVESGRAIYPALEGGTLTVLSDVAEVECNPDPPPPPPPPDVVFRLEDRDAVPGGGVAVPFFIESTLPSQGFAVSIDFDESVLQALEVERLWERPSGTPFDFAAFDIDNTDRFPGAVGVEEGFIAGAVVISLEDSGDVLPPGLPVHVLDLHFEVDAGASSDTEVRFLDGALSRDGVPVKNYLLSGGRTLVAATSSSFILISALLNIIPDGIPFAFIRGDANGDHGVDISDAMRTLGYLFLDSRRIDCLDAADANDDGAINIADATYSLNFLFNGGPEMPPPFPRASIDPTSDGLSCGALTAR